MLREYPRLGVHRLVVTLPRPASPDENWRVVATVIVRDGELVECEPTEFLFMGTNGAASGFSPRSLETSLPLLVGRLYGFTERWFQAERERVAIERKNPQD